jgi:hypothetical protein
LHRAPHQQKRLVPPLPLLQSRLEQAMLPLLLARRRRRRRFQRGGRAEPVPLLDPLLPRRMRRAHRHQLLRLLGVRLPPQRLSAFQQSQTLRLALLQVRLSCRGVR